MVKGILENAILLIMDQGETYGYALQQQLVQNGLGNVSGETIYLLLQELIKAHKKSSSTGPDRKYYQITPKGQQQLQVFLPQWQQLQQAMSKLMGNKGES